MCCCKHHVEGHIEFTPIDQRLQDPEVTILTQFISHLIGPELG